MATIEFQMSATAFLRAQRNAMLRIETCLPGPFAFKPGNNIDSTTIVRGRIEFGANTLVHNVEEEFDLKRQAYGGSPLAAGDRSDQIGLPVCSAIPAIISAPSALHGH